MAISKKQLTQDHVTHVIRELKKIVDEDFDGNQSAAGKALGISQPHISNMLTALKDGRPTRGPGLETLLLMRSRTNRSIDDLLGLTPLGDQTIIERLRATVDTEIARIRRTAKEEVKAAREELAKSAPKTPASELKVKVAK